MMDDIVSYADESPLRHRQAISFSSASVLCGSTKSIILLL